MVRRLHAFLGDWRIAQMELWDRDYLDLEGPAYITFGQDRLGSFQFGAVQGGLDFRVTSDSGAAKVEFSWDGFNDSERSCGRGWAVLDEVRLIGRLYFHNGDDSAFVAERGAPKARPSRSRRPKSRER